MKPPETEEELVEWILRQRVRRGKADVDLAVERRAYRLGHAVHIPSLQGWRWVTAFDPGDGASLGPWPACDFCGLLIEPRLARLKPHSFDASGEAYERDREIIRYHVAQCALAWWATNAPDKER